MTSRRRKAKPDTPTLRTRDEARQWLRDSGVSVTAFARLHGLSRDAVADVLCGAGKGHYGASHRAAVALGIKQNPDSVTDSRKSAQRGRP